MAPLSSDNCPKCAAPIRTSSAICHRCGLALPLVRQPATSLVGASARPSSDPDDVDPVARGRLLAPDEAAIRRLMRQVRLVSHVQENTRHRQVAADCWIHLCSRRPDPNACAHAAPEPCDECGEPRPAGKALTILVNRGLGQFAGLLAAVAASPLMLARDDSRYADCRAGLARCAGVLDDPAGVDGPLAGALMEHAIRACTVPGLMPLAIDVASGMIAFIMAHELAHLSYGHVLGTETSLEVSRNSEREADSFAASVLVGLPNPDRVLIGGVIWWSCLATAEQMRAGSAPATHPMSRARLQSLIESAPSAMQAARAAHGITGDGLLALID